VEEQNAIQSNSAGVEQNQSLKVNLRDVGSGIAQCLPILVQSLLAEKGATIIIEQPELHLHPEAQVALADFFIDQARAGKRFLIETHSEHFLLRFQRRIAETAYQEKRAEDPPRNEGHALKQEDLNVVFVTRSAGESRIEFIRADHYGQLEEPSDEFQGFFSYDYDDITKLSKAIGDFEAVKAGEIE